MFYYWYCFSLDKSATRDVPWFSSVLSFLKGFLVRTTVAQMTRVLWRSSIDVINDVITAVSYIDIDIPLTAVREVVEADLSRHLTLCNCGMSTV